MDQEKVLNPKEVSELIGCSYSQVLVLADSGLLASFSVGSGTRKHRRFRRSAVDSFIESQEAKSLHPVPDPIGPLPRVSDRELKPGILTAGILKLRDKERAREQAS